METSARFVFLDLNEENMTDTYVTKNGKTIRLINENILIRADPDEDRIRNGTILPKGCYDNPYNTGVVLAVGKKLVVHRDEKKKIIGTELIPLPGVQVGDGVFFIRFLDIQDSNKAFQDLYEPGVIRIKTSDIILLFDYAQDKHMFRTASWKPAPARPHG